MQGSCDKRLFQLVTLVIPYTNMTNLKNIFQITFIKEKKIAEKFNYQYSLKHYRHL